MPEQFRYLIEATRDGAKSYLFSWGKLWFFVDMPKHAHRFTTSGEADSILGLLLRENFPGYEHKIVRARISRGEEPKKHADLFA